MALPLSVFIIALNAAKRIGRTIDAIKNLSDDIIAVDSGSTDGTRDMAESHGFSCSVIACALPAVN